MSPVVADVTNNRWGKFGHPNGIYGNWIGDSLTSDWRSSKCLRFARFCPSVCYDHFCTPCLMGCLPCIKGACCKGMSHSHVIKWVASQPAHLICMAIILPPPVRADKERGHLHIVPLVFFALKRLTLAPNPPSRVLRAGSVNAAACVSCNLQYAYAQSGIAI